MSIKSGVQKVVQSLVDKHGGVTAGQLVQAAKPKNSPAHAGFEWDDSKAGEEYRLIQSRNWIKVVVVRYEDKEERLFHVPPTSEEKGQEGWYRTQPVLVTIPDELERAIAEAQTALRAAARTVDALHTAVERHPSPDRSAMVAQIAKGLQIMESALNMVH